MELERRTLQGDGAGVASSAWGLSGSMDAPDGSPLPTEESKRVRAYIVDLPHIVSKH